MEALSHLMSSIKLPGTPKTNHLVSCNVCDTPDTQKNPLKICSRCRCARYCSVDHQKADWPTHKLVCNSLEPVEYFLDNEDLPYRDAHDLSLVFANQDAVGKLLRWIQNDPLEGKDSIKFTQKLPHFACELLISEFGTKSLLPIVFDHYLSYLFRFFDKNKDDKEKPRNGAPINAGFLLLLMNLNKHRRKKELMSILLENNQKNLKALLPYIHIEEIRILVSESFEFLQGNGSKLIQQIFLLGLDEQYAFASNQILIRLSTHNKFAAEIKPLILNRFRFIHELKECPFEHFLELFSSFLKMDSSIASLLDQLIDLMKTPPKSEYISDQEKKFGLYRLHITKCFSQLEKSRFTPKFIQVGVNLFFEYPNCNMFHCHFIQIIRKYAKESHDLKKVLNETKFWELVQEFISKEDRTTHVLYGPVKSILDLCKEHKLDFEKIKL